MWDGFIGFFLRFRILFLFLRREGCLGFFIGFVGWVYGFFGNCIFSVLFFFVIDLLLECRGRLFIIGDENDGSFLEKDVFFRYRFVLFRIM